VYAPVGIQGGLTGALFREFAFTLAGAVVVSGVVALTLSPMMAGKLLRTGDTHRGFAGWINRRFDTVRRVYGRMLAGTLQYRPVVLVLWAIVALLTVPFYMLSQRELAPAEDQGVVFSRRRCSRSKYTMSTARCRRRTAFSRSPSPPAGLADSLPSRGASARRPRRSC
jgi:multidrug efflux pump subunit AcrB